MRTRSKGQVTIPVGIRERLGLLLKSEVECLRRRIGEAPTLVTEVDA